MLVAIPMVCVERADIQTAWKGDNVGEGGKMTAPFSFLFLPSFPCFLFFPCMKKKQAPQSSRQQVVCVNGGSARTGGKYSARELDSFDLMVLGFFIQKKNIDSRHSQCWP